MTGGARLALAQALRLDAPDRAEVASELLASLDRPADLDAEAFWDEEIRRRVREIEAGTVELIPWAEVKKRVEREMLEQRVREADSEKPQQVRFLVTYEYTEVVGGETRPFVHQTAVEAVSDRDAHAAALDYFDHLARHSGVGWTRTLGRCTIARAGE